MDVLVRLLLSPYKGGDGRTRHRSEGTRRVRSASQTTCSPSYLDFAVAWGKTSACPYSVHTQSCRGGFGCQEQYQYRLLPRTEIAAATGKKQGQTSNSIHYLSVQHSVRPASGGCRHLDQPNVDCAIVSTEYEGVGFQTGLLPVLRDPHTVTGRRRVTASHEAPQGPPCCLLVTRCTRDRSVVGDNHVFVERIGTERRCGGS